VALRSLARAVAQRARAASATPCSLVRTSSVSWSGSGFTTSGGTIMKLPLWVTPTVCAENDEIEYGLPFSGCV
jgi:hypothetical protein